MAHDQDLITVLIQLIIAIPLAPTRWLALLSIMPLFSLMSTAGILEMAAAFAFGFPLVIDLAAKATTFDISPAMFGLLVIKEALIGGLLGLLFGVPFWVMQAAGDIFDNVKGEAQSAALDPKTNEEVLPTGRFLSLLYVTYLVTGGGFLLIVGMVYDTFELWPVTEPLPAVSIESLAPLFGFIQKIVLIALTVGGPLIFVIFGVDLMVAFMARSAPNMEVVTLGFSVKSLVGALMLLVYMAIVTDVYEIVSVIYGEALLDLKEAFRGG